jgi:hypothetical protein
MKTSTSNKRLLAAGAGLVAATVGYLLFVRPRHLRWGASWRETQEYLPGDELIPDADSCATHAVTINADLEDVWPWIIQIGQDKGGFYSYTVLENLLGCDMHNTNELRPEWQTLKVGDEVRFHPKFPPVPVVRLKEGEHLVLGADLDGPNASSWAFVVRSLGHGLTRLVVRLRGRPHKGVGHVADLLVIEPAHFVMERKMMLTIKKLAEQRSRRYRAA